MGWIHAPRPRRFSYHPVYSSGDLREAKASDNVHDEKQSQMQDTQSQKKLNFGRKTTSNHRPKHIFLRPNNTLLIIEILLFIALIFWLAL